MTAPAYKICMIAALGRNRGIGKDNQLLWRIPEDLKRFKALTTGHPVIMGRKTFDSIIATLGKPLPNRINVVVSRNKTWEYEGVHAVESLEEAIELSKHKKGGDELFIIGGGQIYAEGIGYADKLYLTLIDDEKEADVFFPDYSHSFKKKTFEEEHEFEGLKYTWLDIERD